MRVPRLFRVASFRFAAFYVGVFVVSAVVLGGAVFLAARAALRQQLAARIETEAAFLGAEFQASGLPPLVALVRTRGSGASALDYLLQGSDGSHLAGEIPAQAGLRPGWATLAIDQDTGDDDERPERERVLVTALGDGTLLAVGGDLAQLDRLEDAMVTAFVGTVGLMAALGIGGGVLLSRTFLRRVDAISRTAEAIIGGDLSRRVPTRGTGDDLDRLASTLNHMLDRIGALMESLRQVSSDVAHDLRTPLSRLFHRLEEARTHARSIADYEEAVDAAVAETQGLLDTFAALLRIAQVEGGATQDNFGAVDLSALVENVADAYRPDAEASGHRLVAEGGGRVIVRGDGELLTQAVANLIENALRHTPPPTRITVRVDGGTRPTLTVEDDGPGAAAADLPRLSDRFYRGERSRTTTGNGLGLTLVAAVAAMHDAGFSLENAHPGLRVALRFR